MRRYYTPDLANRSLPLVRRITEDVRGMAIAMRETWHRLRTETLSGEARSELLDRMKELQERYLELGRELDELGIELKDPFQGLIDFRAHRGETDVYLCWRLGEDTVEFWHELDSGFRGRQPIVEF